jgi:hypothetical protein
MAQSEALVSGVDFFEDEMTEELWIGDVLTVLGLRDD